jgi:hypothetical protein
MIGRTTAAAPLFDRAGPALRSSFARHLGDARERIDLLDNNAGAMALPRRTLVRFTKQAEALWRR